MKLLEDADTLRTLIYLSCYMFLVLVIGIFSAVKTLKAYKNRNTTVETDLPGVLDVPSSDSMNKHQSVTSVSISTKECESVENMNTITSLGEYEQKEAWDEVSTWKYLFSGRFCKFWCMDVFRQRSIYGTIVVYAFDVVTDINVVILWFNNGFVTYGVIALVILFIYRGVSGYSVYKAIPRRHGLLKRIFYGLTQFLDVYIFFEVFHSYQIKRKTDKLKWITSMETSLEAAPQVILQLVYLLNETNVDNLKITNLVLLGLFFSVTKLGTTAIHADKAV